MRFALILALACCTGCSVVKDGPVDCNDATALNAAVAHVVQCEIDYCKSDTGQACACIRSGKDFEPSSCGCTVALSDSAQQAICKNDSGIGTSIDENCEITQPQLAIAITGSSCASCSKDSQCQHGTICVGGQCKPGCRVDSDCDTGTICESSVCRTGCRSDFNCAIWQSCQEGACAGKACTRELDCVPDHSCVAGKCQ